MKRKTIGERVAAWWFKGSFQGGVDRRALANEIDRAIRREKAKAWDEAVDTWVGVGIPNPSTVGLVERATATNPYRGRVNR